MANQLIAPLFGSQAMLHVRFAGRGYWFISRSRVERSAGRKPASNRSQAFAA